MRDYDFMGTSKGSGPYAKKSKRVVDFFNAIDPLDYFSRKTFGEYGWSTSPPEEYLIPREFYRPEELTNNGEK